MKLSEVLKPGMKGVFYGRHSTDKQEMDLQWYSVQKLIEKYDCEIIAQYLDSGVSATKNSIEERNSLAQLLNDAQKKMFDFVVVYDETRIARDADEHQEIRTLMALLGIPIILSKSESLYDTGDLLSQLVKDAASKYEADALRERTKDMLDALAGRGDWTGGKAPYGYRYLKKEKRFEKIEEQIIIVKQIFELYKKGEGFQAIADKLPPEFNGGKPWLKEKVKCIILNPFYAGYVSTNKRKKNSTSGKRMNMSFTDRSEWIMAKSTAIPAIISFEEWEEVYKIYEEKRKGVLPPKHFKTKFILSGILYCKYCDVPLVGKNQTTKRVSTGRTYGDRIYV
jgi:site-specific DNA recombinase